MDSSVSPTHGEQENSVWNGHYACTCYHPLFVFNQFGDLERCALRPGNVHSADGWESVLKPVVERYKGKVSRIYFRADAGFANPEVYEFLEAERIKYAIRLPANRILQERIGHLLTRPVGRPSNEVRRSYANFTYQVGSWAKPRRVVAKVEWHPSELYPRVGFIVTNMARPAENLVAFYNKRGTCEQWIKEAKGAIKWTRLSCRSFADNAVRLQLHALAYNLPTSCVLWRRRSRSRSHGEVDSDRRSGRVRLRPPTLETTMQTVADRPEAPNAIRNDLGVIFISLELSRSTWLITSLSPDGGEKMSKHSVPAGDIYALLARFSEFKQKAFARTGKSFPTIVIQEAGLDGFWIHRVLQNEGIESHVVDPASIATSRRRRRAKTDRIDGEALLRTLLAYKRGEPRVCAMVKAPTPEEEDRRRLCRERKILIAERVKHVNRIKGLLFCQGVSGYKPLRRDRRQRLDELRTGDGRLLPKHLKAQIGRELARLEQLLEQIKAVEAERDALFAAAKAAAPAPGPPAMLLNIKGIGPEFAAILWSEGLFRHFDNRRQVASYAGLAPTLGKVDRSIANRACLKQEIRDCGQHSSNSPGYGCAISRNRRWLCGSRTG